MYPASHPGNIEVTQSEDRSVSRTRVSATYNDKPVDTAETSKKITPSLPDSASLCLVRPIPMRVAGQVAPIALAERTASLERPSSQGYLPTPDLSLLALGQGDQNMIDYDDLFDRQGARNPSLGTTDETESFSSNDDDSQASRNYASQDRVPQDPAKNGVTGLPPVQQLPPLFNQLHICDGDNTKPMRYDQGATTTTDFPIRPIPVRVLPTQPPAPEMPSPQDEPSAQEGTTASKIIIEFPSRSSVESLSELGQNRAAWFHSRANIVERSKSREHRPSDSSDALSPKDNLIRALAVSHGDPSSDDFRKAFAPLQQMFATRDVSKWENYDDFRANSVEGTWLQLSRPAYDGCLGESDNGDPMYTLGRLSFDMFAPTDLICSIQGSYNVVEPVPTSDRSRVMQTMPATLREEVQKGDIEIHTYHLVTMLTVEACPPSFPNSPNKDVLRPIHAVQTTFGYTISNPQVPNRLTVWFTGSRLEPSNHPNHVADWNRLFALHPPEHTLPEKLKLMVASFFLGGTKLSPMAQDGSIEFSFSNPAGGHDQYIDELYWDKSIRVLRGKSGTTYVLSKSVSHPETGWM